MKKINSLIDIKLPYCSNYYRTIKYCKDKLPTQEGFFFGSTDYDEYYYRMLVYTKERLNYILKNIDFEKESIYYSSSW